MISSGFFVAYLVSYVYWLAFPLGALAILMMFRLTGGAWGKATEPYLESAVATLPAFALLFIPVLFGQREIYPWTHEVVKATLHGGNRIYLTPGFFSVRAIIYFLGLILFGIGALRRESPSIGKISAAGLVFYGFATSFASFDWQMSLDPEWHSTVYGLIFGISLVLECWAGILLLISMRPDFAKQDSKTQRDLTNILLAFTMIWAYLSYVQYLIIWCGNMPDEVVWMYRRTHHGWQVLALMLVVLQFALPFSLLLFRQVKTRARNVRIIAGIILVARLVEQYWYIEPGLHHDQFVFNLWIIPTLVILGAIWLSIFRATLKTAEGRRAASI